MSDAGPAGTTTPGGDTSAGDLIDYARKTYRYLRLAIVAMVVALGASIIDVAKEADELKSSISAYYYDETHAIFIGALVMIGVCLIAIRGVSDFEETALNYAGMLAPVVALVPTTAPSEPLAVTEDTIEQNLLSMGFAGIVTVLAAVLLAGWLRQQPLRQRLQISTVVGLGLVAVSLLALRILYVEHGTSAAHNAAAIVMFVALWTVVTRNAVRHLGTRPEQFASAVVATIIVAAVVGTVVGIAGASRSGPAAWAFLALVPLLILVVARSVPSPFRDSLRRVLRGFPRLLGQPHPDRPDEPRRPRNDYYCLWYAVVAVVMASVPLIVVAWPGDFDTKVFWVEVAALVPFAIFWLVQTIEKWNDVVEVDDRTTWATPGTAA